MEQVYSYNPRTSHGAVKVLNFRPVNFSASPLPWPMCHIYIKFCDQFSSFYTILLTNKQTYKLMPNAHENITSLVED